MMRHSQVITGGPSYSRDMWDPHGVKMISERIDKAKKSMKQLRDFFQDAANMSFRNAQTTGKLQQLNIAQNEFGTLKFVEDRYCELIGNMYRVCIYIITLHLISQNRRKVHVLNTIYNKT